ncbi:MAG: ribonuclease R, partial [Burkholderiaceae bacterium]
GVCIVVPEDQRIKHDILIPAQEINQAEHGQVVTVQIMQQPTRHTQPLGRVVEVLGEIDDPGMEIEIAVRKFGVPHEFSELAQSQAAVLPAAVLPAELKGRVDLRDVPFVTIDGEDARDFDDAVFCMPVNLGTEKRRRAGWRLLVAIADVSHYVRPGDSIDNDALERGTSVYFPRRVIPMLPEALSNGICSLNPSVDRLVLVCDMVIAGSGQKAGQITAYQFYNAVIHSHARCTYTQVWEALQQPGGPAAASLADVLPGIRDLHELYQLFAAARVKRGAIDFDTVETRIVCTPLGRIERIEAHTRNDAHKLIEECMLAANTCAAEFMTRNKRHGLYRVHEGPTPQKLQTLRDYLATIGLSLEGGDDPGTDDYARLVQQARGRPDYEIIQTMCLRSLQQAIYSPEQAGHFGLSYEHYAHFTSPIRRYPDLLTHRVIKGILAGKRYVPKVHDVASSMVLPRDEKEQATWEKLGLVLSAAERRADDASRDVEAWLKCWFIKEHVGEIFSGRVTGVAPFGLFITLETLFVEGMVHVSELGSDYFQYNEASHELRGERTGMRYRLTDAVQVQVARVDLEARRIDFRLVKGTSFKALTAAAKPTASRQGKKAASTKPEALKGTTASQRRADAKRSARKTTASTSRKKGAGVR